MTAPREPAVGYSTNPLCTLTQADMRAAPEGATVYSLMPKDARGPVRCYLNGESLYPITQRQMGHHLWLLESGRDAEARAYLDWATKQATNWVRTKLRAGDVLHWHEVTQKKDIVTAVIVVAAIVYGFYSEDWASAARYAAYAFAVENVVLPPTLPRAPSQGAAADAIYNTSLNGNEARLDQPIWKVCGLTKITPPFAAQPYYEYHENGEVSNAQFYYAVFAVGVGNHDLLGAFIGKTPIGNYQDVTVQQYLPPGTQPSVALCNVVSSAEVTALVLDSGKFAGPYVSCQPKRKCAFIGIDTMAPQGLGLGGVDGAPGFLSVEHWVYARDIDDYGRPLTPWRVLQNFSASANTNTPLRWSNKIAISPPARLEVKVVRMDVKNTTAAARHELSWIGLRAYLDEAAPLNPNVAHYEVVMRASDQLSLNAQRDFSVIVQALTRTWTPDDGWGPEVATRNPAWWLAELWTNAIWGEGLPDARIDLAGLYAWAQVCDARQDRVDYAFVNSRNAWDAAQVIARSGRARCFRRFGINTLVRDELVSLPTTAFTYRNTVAKSMTMSESLPGRDAADGYVIEYTSNVTWDTNTIECPCPGVTVTDPTSPRYHAGMPVMAKPIYLRLEGIQGATHAEREGLYEAAVMLWRRRTVKCKTEMQGVVSAYGDSARWMPEIANYGQSGDVIAWDVDTLTMTLSEPALFAVGPGLPTWSFSWDGIPTPTVLSGADAPIYLRLIRDDGSLTEPVQVLPGPVPTQIVLPEAPDFDIVTEDGTRERPKFLLGVLNVGDELVKITSISDGGKSNAESGMDGAQLYDIAGVVDDDRVHGVDVFLLPGPGDIQDPVVVPATDPDTGGDDGGGDFLYVLALTDKRLNSYGTAENGWIAAIAVYLTNTGHAHPNGVDYYPEVDYPGEWMHFGTVDPSRAALYEARATFLSRLVSPATATWVGPGEGDYVYTPRVLDTGVFPLVSPSSDALDTWVNLGTTRHWGVTLDPGPAIDNGVFSTLTKLRYEIREIATGVVQASAVISFYCQGYPA